MNEFGLKGTERKEFGKKAARDLRKQDLIPCILYGVKRDEKGLPVSTHFTVKYEDVLKLVYSPDIYVVNVEIDGQVHKAVMRELQFHPVTDRILHMDFYEVTEDKPIVMEVPIVLEGHAEGVKAGGKLVTEIRKIKVRSVYTNIPERLNINIDHLHLGKTLKVGELHFDNLELVTPKEVVVCAVRSTRQTAAAAPAADAAAAPAADAAAAEK